MSDGLLGTRSVVQIGLIVRDISRTAGKYADFFGVAPPQIITTNEYDKALTQYRGEPTPARAKLAFFELPGGLQIELIEPDENPSTWREFLENRGEGVHHLAFLVKGMGEKAAKLEKSGVLLVQKGEYTGGRYAYFDGEADLKVLIELLEND